MSLVSKKKKWHTIYVAVSLLRLTPVTLGNSALSPHFFSLPDWTPKEKPTTNFYFVCHRYASQRPVHKLLLMFFSILVVRVTSGEHSVSRHGRSCRYKPFPSSDFWWERRQHFQREKVQRPGSAATTVVALTEISELHIHPSQRRTLTDGLRAPHFGRPNECV
jgi:hypothetical protein